ncbi:hypothetical protein KEM56_006467, partial [Ascosphaera pollenicola]
MSSTSTSITKRKRSSFTAPRQRGSIGRTASLPNPRANGKKSTARTSSTAATGAASKKRFAGRYPTTSVISSDAEEDLIDDEAEEATEEDPEDDAGELDDYDEGEDDRDEEGEEEDYGAESPTPGATLISSSPEPEYMLAELVEEPNEREQIESSDPQIPPKLLTRLLHHHFQNDKTKIAKDANMVVAKYVD